MEDREIIDKIAEMRDLKPLDGHGRSLTIKDAQVLIAYCDLIWRGMVRESRVLHDLGIAAFNAGARR